MKVFKLSLALFYFASALAMPVAQATNSTRWGVNGELWNSDTTTSTISDFSFAGYRMGTTVPASPTTLLGTEKLTPIEGAKHLERSISSFDAISLLQNKIDEIKNRQRM